MKLQFFAVFLLLFLIPTVFCYKSLDDVEHYDEEFDPGTFTHYGNTTTKEPVNDTFDYHICANKDENTNCYCGDDEIKCDQSYLREHQHDDYEYPDDNGLSENIIFENLNIKIMNQSIVVKHAIFNDNNITKLEKDKILPEVAATVERLELRFNYIKVIENGTFDKFTTLKYLDLSNNHLNNFTVEVFTKQLGSTLITLNLSQNSFKSIFKLNFTNLIILEELYLSKNILTFQNFTFPPALSNLKTLSLDHCGIKSINDEIFSNLIHLESLYLDGNRLTSVPKAINALVNLELLDIGGNHILNLNKTNFKNNINLKSFYMTHSFLKRIEDCTFCDKPNLKRVNLYHNKRLTWIHENAFGNVASNISPMLESFFVESCNLSMIPENLLNWHTVEEFGLGDNPFICNCSMAWLINDILSPTHSMNMKQYIDSSVYYSHEHVHEPSSILKCYGPLALINIPFTRLSEKFCKNEIKKVYECKNEGDSWMPGLYYFAGLVLAFIFGMSVIPIFRHLLRFKKQRAAFRYTKEEDEDKIEEDFDTDTKI